MITLGGEGWVCTDCIIVLANGDAPCHLSDEELETYLAEIKHRTQGVHVVPGLGEDWHFSLGCRNDGDCDCETDSFSMTPCDTCGESLAGRRHGVSYLSRA